MQRAFETKLHTLVPREGSSILMAVSGGIDSMVMASLFAASPCKPKVAIAHVNFGLRGDDSDADQALVCNWAQTQQIPCYVQRFDTRAYATNHKLSVEMAARELRYRWFEELRQELKYDHVAVAHHANDHAETILLNLARGTGVRGLCGIPDKRGAIIRPMLDFSRAQIETHAKEKGIPYRHDATNALPDFHRNRVRHTVVPELTAVNPNLTARLRENSRYLQQACTILEERSEEKRRMWCKYDNNVIYIDIESIVKEKHAEYWLFELLRPYGFKAGQMDQVMGMLHGGPGGRAASITHMLHRDRTFFALIPHSQKELVDQEYVISFFDSSQYVIGDGVQVATLDAGKLHFPLTLRTWQKGDRFIPFGMKGFKKVSDFLIDVKVPLWEKERQQVLCSNEEIVWLVGRRIDDRFKVTEATAVVAQVTLSS
ncbi:MAG: tRNA lysidine(34) synthetase TilS [Bacteroidales bacterium]|nr:tRNA lysidine(34) synthetase TilS [Bacteroidales bacterium]